MNSYLPIIIAATLAVAKSTAPPILKLETLRYYDEFGDPAIYFLNSGHVSVECQVDGSGPINLLDPDNKVISKARTDFDETIERQLSAMLRLNITDTTKFGKYRSQYDGQGSAEAVDLDYRFCSDTNSMCYSDGFNRCKRQHYCIETANGVEPCSDLLSEEGVESWCDRLQVDEADVIYCPDNLTLCKAEFAIEVKSQMVGKSCSHSSISLHLEVDTIFRDYNDPIRVNMDVPLPNISISVSYSGIIRNLKAYCTIKDTTGQIVVAREYVNFAQDKKSAHIRMIDIFVHPLFKSRGFRVYKMYCMISNSTNILGRLMNRVAYFGAKPVINASSVNGTITLRCSLTPPPAPPFYIDLYNFGRFTQFESVNGSITNPQPGNYSCIVFLSYQRCSKDHKQYSDSSESDMFLVDANLKSKLENTNSDGNGALQNDLPPSYIIQFFCTLVLGILQQSM